MKTRDYKRMTHFEFFKTTILGISKKNNTFIVWCMVIPLGPLQFTPRGLPKAL